MLYKLQTNNGVFKKITPTPFKDFRHYSQSEQDLETLISDNLFGVLFEHNELMPIFQERRFQPEADIYALNAKGELFIFELKRGIAGEGAVHQLLRYAQAAGQWSYDEIQRKYQQYSNEDNDLVKAHQHAFDLNLPLDKRQFNNRQHLNIIGSAADDKLIGAVDYWRRQGLSINFLPYRIYKLDKINYFEFFAPPYDEHQNPTDLKGVIFDTNRTQDENAIWYMIGNNRLAGFGDAARFVEYVNPRDIVFFSHRWAGIVAAAEVRQGRVKSDGPGTRYRDIEFITPIPEQFDELPAMPFRRVAEVTGKNFYWARTIKNPYLSMEEAMNLVEKLKQHIGA